MAVEMKKSLLIGKAAKPKCFKNLKINNLPMIWKNNKKAWMTAATMEEWLNMFKAKMKQENRSVILFLNNATCHTKASPSNVKIAWFPANATSALHPMDMDATYTFRSHYRRFRTQFLYLECRRSREILRISKISVGSGCCELGRICSEEN
jgi:hypothetical protein